MPSWIERGNLIIYSKAESRRCLINELVQFNWDIIEQGGIEEINAFFEQIDVKKVHEYYMLPLILRNFYAVSGLIPTWKNLYEKIRAELDWRDQDTKKLLRGCMAEPTVSTWRFGPHLKKSQSDS